MDSQVSTGIALFSCVCISDVGTLENVRHEDISRSLNLRAIQF